MGIWWLCRLETAHRLRGDLDDRSVVYRDVAGHCKILHEDYWNVDNCGPLAVYGAAGFPLGNSSPTTQLMPVIWARDKALASYDY